MCICGGAGKIYAEREILLCFGERFPMGVMHTGFPYRQETMGERVPAAVIRTGFPYRQKTAGERFPAVVMHYGLPYRQETLLQNILTLVHYHLVLCEGKKKPVGGEIIIKKIQGKNDKNQRTSFSSLGSCISFHHGDLNRGNFLLCFQLTIVQLMYILYHLFPKLQALFHHFFKIFMQTKTPWLLDYDVFDYLS